jgi:hypothetical protein
MLDDLNKMDYKWLDEFIDIIISRGFFIEGLEDLSI